jgi:hypothetical protein
MAGKIVADTLEHSTAGSIATNYVVNGSAKAWCFFDGTAGTISFSDSFNGSSLSDSATGQYDMNFSSSMSNNTYPALFSGADRNDNRATSPQSSSSCRMFNRMGIDGNAPSDNDEAKCQFSLHGDLA